jgi:hypothetical protein
MTEPLRLCKATGCTEPIEKDKVVCIEHWRKVPIEVQQAVYREYRRGAGSPAHLAAVKAVVAAASDEKKQAPSG